MTLFRITRSCRLQGQDKAYGEPGICYEAPGTLLGEKGSGPQEGAIVDATLVSATRRDDPDGTWVKRGNKKSTFGSKATISVDKDTMMVRRVHVSPAHEHDTKFFEDGLPMDVHEVYADKGYDDQERRRRLREKGIKPSWPRWPGTSSTPQGCAMPENDGEEGRILQNYPKRDHPRRNTGIKDHIWISLSR